MKTKSKQMLSKILMIVIAAALILSSLLLFASCNEKKEDASSLTPSTSSISSEEQKINVTFKIIKDGETKEISLSTGKKYLADALVEAEIVEYAEDGYYTTINGITADYSKDRSFWSITVNGKISMVGMNEIELKAGASYEAIYTIG